jgi:hypothetical protein
MAFNDGDPIDAALLTVLEERVSKVESLTPKVGIPGSTVIAQMYAGISGEQTIVPGVDKRFTIDYSAANLASAPSSVILTPVHSPFATHIDFYVISAGARSAECGAYISKSTAITEKKVSFYYFVITN